MESLRFGMVGTGYWADEVHAAGVASHPDAQLVGVWGRDPQKASRVAARHDAEAFAEVDDLLDAVDAVVFAVPPQVQADIAVRAAEAGKHLLLEKPVATSLEEADRLVDAVSRNDVSTVVFFTERFVPARESWLQDRIDNAPLGARATWMASLQTPDNPFAGSPWRQEDGALWDVGPHALSILLPALGPVADVTGFRGHGDLVSLVLRHESGATSTLQLSLTMPPDATLFEVKMYDEHGWRLRPDDDTDVVEAQQRAVSELVENVRAGRCEHRCDVRFGRDVVEVLHRAEQVVGRPAADQPE
jgi:predicted dehydrogenase